MKKFILAVAIVSCSVVALANSKIGSHISAWSERMSKKADAKVPPKVELDRIRHELGKLDKDIDKVKGELAEANVNARHLAKDVKALEEEVSASEKRVRDRGQVVSKASKEDEIEWCGRTVSYTEAKTLLASNVKRHNEMKIQLQAKRTQLASTMETRELIELQLQEMISQKEELTKEVNSMENEIKLAEVEQIRSRHQNDGTRMADIKKSLSELRKKVEVQREKVRIDNKTDKNPASDKSVEEILAELDGPAKNNKPTDEVKVIVKP